MAQHMDRHNCGRCGLTLKLGKKHFLALLEGRLNNWPGGTKIARTRLNLIDPAIVKAAQEAYQKKMQAKKDAEAAAAAEAAAGKASKKDAKKGKKKWFHIIP